jgi:hypothetical protein
MASKNFSQVDKAGAAGIWQHFLKEKQGQSAKCINCQAELKTTGGSTKGLHEHMKRVHNISTLKRKGGDDSDDKSKLDTKAAPSSTSNIRPLDKFVLEKNEQTLEAVLGRMTACDGLSFRVFVSSSDLRRALSALGFGNLPTSVETVKQLVMRHGQKVRTFITNEIASRKRQGQRFSVSFDEWTSTRNRRFMNVNVHGPGSTFWGLGLIRVHGSMPAEKCVELLQQKLDVFGLSLTDDIVCIVTDGASVMQKVGKLIEAEQQLCLAHGIQLAVLDVLYQRREHSRVNNDGDDDSEDDDGRDQCLDVLENEEYDALTELSGDFQQAVDKVRQIVKLFKRSPTKNDEKLQVYVKQEFGKELSLVADCKTRWNSLFDMLSRFIQLRSSIQKAMIDLKEPVTLTARDFAVIQEIVSTLEPVKLVVKSLGRRETNLISAEAALNFCIVALQKQGSEVACTMAEALQSRIGERRATFAGVLQYLHTGGNTDSSSMIEIFSIPTKNVLQKFINSMVVRLGNKSEARGRPVSKFILA